MASAIEEGVNIVVWMRKDDNGNLAGRVRTSVAVTVRVKGESKSGSAENVKIVGWVRGG